MPKQSILPKHAPHRDQFSFHKVCTQCSTAREARTWSQLTTRNDRSKRQTLVHASSPNSSSPFPRGTTATTLDGSYSSVLPAVSVGRRRPSEHAGCPGRKPHGSPHGERRRCLTAGGQAGRAGLPPVRRATAAPHGGGAGNRTRGSAHGSRQGRAPTAAAYGGGAGHRTQGEAHGSRPRRRARLAHP